MRATNIRTLTVLVLIGLTSMTGCEGEAPLAVAPGNLPDEPMAAKSPEEVPDPLAVDYGGVGIVTGTPFQFTDPLPVPLTDQPGPMDVRGAPIRPNDLGLDRQALVATPPQEAITLELTDLARALGNNVYRIYEYVYDTIEFTPLWGLRKSAMGVVADRSGTALEQANLMAMLLRAAGYSADVMTGDIRLGPAAVEQMFGTSDVNALAALIPSAGIPMPTGEGLLVDASGALASARFAHAWVRVTGKELRTVAYHFDPARKTTVVSAGSTELAKGMGYDRATFVTALGGTGGDLPGSLKGLAGGVVRNTLHTYATNLIANLDSAHSRESLQQALGGRTIVRLGTASPPRLATNPVAVVGSPQSAWNAANPIPGSFRPSLRLQLAGIDKTFAADALWGKRLVIRYGADLKAVLTLDGVVLATATTAGASNQSQTLIAEVDEPYDAFNGSYGDQTGELAQKLTLKVGAGFTYAILSGWGDTNRGSVDYRRRRVQELRDSGLSADSESVLGESLALLGDLWLAERTGFRRLADAATKTFILSHHAVGVAGHAGAPYVDIPLVLTSSVASSNKDSDRLAAFMSLSGFGSTLESTVIEQTQDALGISTVSLFEVANDAGNTFYDGSAPTWPSLKARLLTLGYDSNTIANPEGFISKGYRLLIPGNGKLGKGGSWSGFAFLAVSPNGVAHIINNAKGGYASIPIPPAPTTIGINNTSLPPVTSNAEPKTGDPVSIVSGDFIHGEADLSLGPNDLLQFRRVYSSGDSAALSPLGRGWGHVFDVHATVGSDGFQGLGEDSAVDAATTLVALYIVYDLIAADLAVGAVSARTLLTTSLIQQWAGQALVDNTVNVGTPAIGSALFTRVPNGLSGSSPLFAYRAPLGNPATLEKPANFRLRSASGVVSTFNTDGTIATILDPNNVGLTFTYAGTLSKVTHSFGWVMTFGYTGSRLTSVSNGVHSVGFTYDTANNLKTFTDSRAKVTTYNYVSPGKLLNIFAPGSATVPNVINTYDVAGRIKEQRNANGALTQYFVTGTRTQEVDPTGRRHTWYFDPTTRLTLRELDFDGRTTTFKYDGRRSLVETRLPEGNGETRSYDGRYNLIERRVKPKTGTKDLVTTATYDPVWNKPVTTVDELGNTTTYTYDARGNLYQRTAPMVDGAQPTATTVYNSRGQLEKVTDSTNRVTTYVYDEAGKKALLSTIVDPSTLKLTTSYTYDAEGNVASVTDPRGNKRSMTWTASRKPLVDTSPIPEAGKPASVTTYVYDANDRLSDTQRTLGAQVLHQQRQYTATDKLQTVSSWAFVVDANTPVRSLTYDLADRLLTETDREGRVTHYEYASNGQLGAIDRAWGAALQTREVEKRYTPNGRLATELSATNGLTTYEYDEYDRPVRTSFPSSVAPGSSNAADYELRTYDDASRVTSLRTRSGQTFTFTYDALGRMRSRAGGGLPTVSYVPDAAGRTLKVGFADASQSTSTDYDSAGRAVAVTESAGTWARTLRYGYDSAGNLVHLRWPDNSFVTYEYDANNELRSVKERGINALVTLTYDQLRRLDTEVSGGVTSKFDYWPSGDVYHLSHDALGTADDVTFTYGYNREQQVVSAWAANPAYVYEPGAVNSKQTLTSDLADRLKTVDSTGQVYDANGNLISLLGFSLQYDALNRLTSATKNKGAATYAYDAIGRRVTKTVNGVVGHSLYSGSSLVADYSAANALVRRYVPNPRRPGQTLCILEGRARSSLLEDRLGSVVAVADNTGTVMAKYKYGAFGERSGDSCQATAAGCVKLGWAGQPFDAETGLVDLKARVYSPELGRFMQADPIGYRDDRNLYAYTHNDPVNFVDPNGTARSSLGNVLDTVGAAFNATTAGISIGVTLPLPRFEVDPGTSGFVRSVSFEVTVPTNVDYSMRLPTPDQTMQTWTTVNRSPTPSTGLELPALSLGVVSTFSPQGTVASVVEGNSSTLSLPLGLSAAGNASGFVTTLSLGPKALVPNIDSRLSIGTSNTQPW